MTNKEAIKQLQGMVVGAEWLSEYMVKALDMAISALEQLSPQWIAVEDGLPEDDGEYWVTNTKGHVVVYVFDSNGNSEEYWHRCAKAWMPYCRPEPYQERRTDGGFN